MSRRLAVLVTHGMGEQRAFELTDTLVQGLTGALPSNYKSHMLLEHQIVVEDETVSPISWIRISFPEGDQSGVEVIDIHEVYWADKPQGLIKLKEVGQWLFRSSVAPLRRWSQNAALFYREEKERKWWRSVGLFLKEVLTAALLPLLGALLILFALTAWNLVDAYIDALGDTNFSPEGWDYAWMALFALAVIGAIALVGGALGIRGQVKFERDLVRETATDPTPLKGRWKWLGGWTVLTLLAVAALAVAVWAIWQRTQVPEVLGALLLVEGRLEPLPLLWAVVQLVAPFLAGYVLIRLFWEIPLPGAKGKLRFWAGALRVVGSLVILALTAWGLWWVGNRLEEPAIIVFSLAGLVAVWMASKFLVGSIGDVAIYLDGIGETSPHHETRENILTTTTRRLVDLLEDASYTEVWVVGHSLGSVITYDAINRVATARRTVEEAKQARQAALDEEGMRPKKKARMMEKWEEETLNTESIVGADSFDKLRGFYSFGSPLDKVVYLFFKTAKPQAPVRDQMLSSLVSFERTSSGRPYGWFAFKRYQPRVPEGFRWFNAWSWGDVLGHRLDFFKIHQQIHFDYPPIVSHFLFWKDEDFYRSVLKWMNIESAPEPQSENVQSGQSHQPGGGPPAATDGPASGGPSQVSGEQSEG